MAALTHEEMRLKLQAEVDRAGGIRQLAGQVKLSTEAIRQIVGGYRPIPPSIASRFGYARRKRVSEVKFEDYSFEKVLVKGK